MRKSGEVGLGGEGNRHNKGLGVEGNRWRRKSTKVEGVSVIKDEDLKIEEIESSNTLG